ncbi:MAG: DUF2167 domain-containing protein [Janthinobacterium lividum]
MKKSLSAILILLASTASWTTEAAPAPRPKKSLPAAATVDPASADSIDATFRYQTGRIALPGGIGELTVPAGFHYLDSTQSAYVLHELWHNPRRANLGMLFPTDAAPLAAKSWGYIVEFDPIGHVKDADAASLDDRRLLADMQRQTEGQNAERVAAGYAPIHVAGWGAKPAYDSQYHALHWGKLLRFGTDPTQTLNYQVRVLGRQGVLVLNAIAEPRYLPEIKSSMPALLAGVQFARGEQYADFQPEHDELAAYSLGGLVAGKSLGGAGTVAVLGQFWKAGLLAVGAVWTAVKRLKGYADKAA